MWSERRIIQRKQMQQRNADCSIKQMGNFVTKLRLKGKPQFKPFSETYRVGQFNKLIDQLNHSTQRVSKQLKHQEVFFRDTEFNENQFSRQLQRIQQQYYNEDSGQIVYIPIERKRAQVLNTHQQQISMCKNLFSKRKKQFQKKAGIEQKVNNFIREASELKEILGSKFNRVFLKQLQQKNSYSERFQKLNLLHQEILDSKKLFKELEGLKEFTQQFKCISSQLPDIHAKPFASLRRIISMDLSK